VAAKPEESLGFLMWRATLRWQRGVAAVLTPLDLTHVQFVLLASTWWLNAQGEHPNQLAIATHAGTDTKMTSQVLRSLEEKGLVQREVNPHDTRAKRLRVTERGAELAPRAVAEVERVDGEFFSAVPYKDMLATLHRLLEDEPS
jgi:DNA-binding MarR family transcriptional regulator